MKHDNEIKICGCHDYKVPLIWTFKFSGAEYWCPYCGHTTGMLGAGINVKIPGTDLLQRQAAWKEITSDFLSSDRKEFTYNKKLSWHKSQKI